MAPSRHLVGYDFKASVQHAASCTPLSKKAADGLSSFKLSKLSRRDQNIQIKLDQTAFGSQERRLQQELQRRKDMVN